MHSFKQAIIVGSGFEKEILKHGELIASSTQWGECNEHIVAPALHSNPQSSDKNSNTCFMARHGINHNLLPQQVNYLANIAALKQLGVERIISINVVGAVNPVLKPGQWVIPSQLIDYTWGRENSFYLQTDKLANFDVDPLLKHVDFTEPFTAHLRNKLNASVGLYQEPLFFGGTYGVTQGPRLETAAKIAKLARDEVDIVGMTAMPEAVLARELSIEYAALSLVVNMAAGVVNNDKISIAEIKNMLEKKVEKGLAIALAAF